VENLLLVFQFSGPLRLGCGNVEISPPFGEISKELVERVGSLLLAFHAFHSSGISTALRPRFFRAAAGCFHASFISPSACCFFLASSTR